jgi:magnesium-transporting ATPase (P-type)
LALARGEPAPGLRALASRLESLSQAEVDARLKQVGPNAIARKKRQSPLMHFLCDDKDPLVILPLGLAVISFLRGT